MRAPAEDAAQSRKRCRDLPTIYTYRPRCPGCGSDRLRVRRTTRHPDGAIERNTRCRECEKKFKIIDE